MLLSLCQALQFIGAWVELVEIIKRSIDIVALQKLDRLDVILIESFFLKARLQILYKLVQNKTKQTTPQTHL